MKLFDLHCDTLDKISKFGGNLEKSPATVSLDSMRQYEKCVRCFAVWTDDVLTEPEANQRFNELYNVFKEQLSLFGNEITQITDKKSLLDGKIGLILTVENGAVLNGKLSEIEKLACLGVKMLTLTWNGENSLGFGQLKNRGLKPFGRECIPLLEKNGIIIDVSHLSDAGFEDVCKVAKKPFAASHSNARSVCNHKRNLTDQEICEMIRRKCLIGLNLYSGFLNNSPEKAGAVDVLRHAEHILSLGGENVLAIGTDFDGGKMVADFDSDYKLVKIEKLFLENGFSPEITDKILYKNAEKFFLDNL